MCEVLYHEMGDVECTVYVSYHTMKSGICLQSVWSFVPWNWAYAHGNWMCEVFYHEIGDMEFSVFVKIYRICEVLYYENGVLECIFCVK